MSDSGQVSLPGFHSLKSSEEVDSVRGKIGGLGVPFREERLPTTPKISSALQKGRKEENQKGLR